MLTTLQNCQIFTFTAVFDQTNHKTFPEKLVSQAFQEMSWFGFERKVL
ncbi:hypothetical protein [Pseudanabaena mucicola]|nr:hypothetical protein [Pseudanabaena mucicola]